MKKILILLVACLMIFSLSALVVSGEGESFDVVITGTSSVTTAPVGGECTFKISYENITADGGLVASDVDLYFDPAVLEFVSAESCSIDGWLIDDPFVSKSTGLIHFRPVDFSLESPVTESGKLYFTVTFKVLETNVTTTELAIRRATASNLNADKVNGTMGTLSIGIAQKLSTPTNLTWEGSIAKWDAVENADSYVVQAYKGGDTVGDPVTVIEPSLDFSELLLDGGKYTFTVIAVTNDPTYFDSDESTQSESEYTVVGRLVAPKIKFTQNLANGGFDFVITDTNASGTVAKYRIDVYEKDGDEIVTSVEVTKKSGSVACDGTKIVAGEEYVATVTAITADAEKNRDSDPSAKTSAVTAVAKVKKIAFKTEPNLIYTEGDKLNLTAMVVTLTYEDGETVNVAFADFALYHLTTDPENGITLQLKNNGDSITVSYAGAVDSKSLTLQVKSAECPHANKEVQQQEPTCGEAGYDREVCEDCGVTVSENTLPATGLHSYGNWIVEIEPTPSMKGVKKRICAICNFIEYGEVDFAVTTEPETVPPPATTVPDSEEAPVTSDVETDPETEEEDPGEIENSMDDLSLIFLIVVIVIFALILIFMVGGIFMEGRRKKARAANRKRHPQNRG